MDSLPVPHAGRTGVPDDRLRCEKIPALAGGFPHSKLDAEYTLRMTGFSLGGSLYIVLKNTAVAGANRPAAATSLKPSP